MRRVSSEAEERRLALVAQSMKPNLRDILAAVPGGVLWVMPEEIDLHDCDDHVHCLRAARMV
jgi:hypothetical protein